ncbi:MAG: OTU family ubiquitin thioesterase, partial [Candidatus Thiodiazotropha endolucinida]|nr:hypothetical protein [Candidatus Thiodiazotropha taylori]MCW4346534.1 OTU family ubiquitin thioesterase [Candidatus Thiodiazotropha endolucinida]
LLGSNGLERQLIKPDGNCFFNSVIHQIHSEMSVTELRSKLCRHLRENERHYIGYISKSIAQDELQLSENYGKMIDILGHNGIWNVEMSDVLPLATANMLQKNITIYSSRLNNPIINVVPNLGTPVETDTTNIKLAYMAVPGFEHYDSCIQIKEKRITNVQSSFETTTKETEVCTDSEIPAAKTPTKGLHSSSTKCVTPRKKADYVSPKKMKQSRRKVRNVKEWKKNIRKVKRNTGQAYVSDKSKKSVAPRQVLPSSCNNCKNKCAEKVNEETRHKLFQSYYDQDMTFERKRDFICQHVEIQATSN